MKLDELWLKTRRGVLYALYLIGALLVQNVISVSYTHLTLPTILRV